MGVTEYLDAGTRPTCSLICFKMEKRIFILKKKEGSTLCVLCYFAFK